MYVGLGDGGSGGDPEDRAQNMDSLLGKMLRIDVNRPGAQAEIVALGLATRGATRSTARPAISTSATSARGRSRRSTSRSANSPGLENYGWDLFEGRSRFEDTPQGPGRLIAPVAQYAAPAGTAR